ncbi:MAG TPA: hypothetical protein PLF01_06745, partial [Alphaproteobacteria bacterium]|nr:hypothetical protein [Alphaproteobacteria bacterium]
GPVVINISNRHLDLRKPLAAIAANNGYFFRYKLYQYEASNPYDMSSEWAILSKDENMIRLLDKKGWSDLETDLRPWTDDYSNFLSTLKIFNFKNHPREQEE